jgi:predicted restriction endonuclease
MIKLVIIKPTNPVKRHIKRSGMRKSYHLRIQKKWNKRFGFTYPDAISKGNVILDTINQVAYVSPEQYYKLKYQNANNSPIWRTLYDR